MSLAQRMAAIDELTAACPQRWTGARVLSATREHDIRLTVEHDGSLVDITTRSLIIATGRLSPIHLRWLGPLGVRFTFHRLEFGLRIESSSHSPLFKKLEGIDPKLRFIEHDGAEARTFCVCRDGEVVPGRAGDLCAWSGRADGPPSGRSNLGLLVRTSDEPLARSVMPTLFAAASRSLPLADITQKTLNRTFGPGAALVHRALDRLHARCPALAHDREAVAHTPCIEGVGDYPAHDGALRLADDIWAAGDVSGRFRGIVASMISGRYAAMQLSRSSTTRCGGTRSLPEIANTRHIGGSYRAMTTSMQPPVRILGSYVSPYVRKVLAVLELKNIPYEVDPIVAFYADDEFSKISPLRRIPVLIDDQISLTDSTVICEYLDERHPAPPLLPRGAAARARARWLEEYADTRMGEVFIWRLFNQHVIQRFVWGQEPDLELLRRTHEEDVPHIFDYLETQLPDDGFIFDELSLADIAIAAPLRNAAFVRLRVDPDRWPRTAGFADRMHALPCFNSLRPFEELCMRTPICDHREALHAAGAPLTGSTFHTASPRRGFMRI